MIRPVLCLALVGCLAVVGCGQNASPTPNDRPDSGTDPLALAEGKRFLLASEPTGVKGVIDVRKNARAGDEVVVAGQVGGSERPFTEGRASFLIADESLKPTEGCDCPWDFCEYDKKDLVAARLSVKFVDAEGKTVKTSAQKMFGLKELRGVVVKGKVQRDEHDNVSVVASGIYVRPEAK